MTSPSGFARSLVLGDRTSADAALRSALASSADLATAELDLIQPAMYEVGELWARGEITVAQEHLATATCQMLLARHFAEAPAALPNGRRAILACVDRNHHALGLRMVADAMELGGWGVDYLGADTPAQDLITHVGSNSADVLGLSASMDSQLAALEELVGTLRAELGQACPQIAVGGLRLNQADTPWRRIGADAWCGNGRDALERLAA